jgi:hypothetical protein
MSSFVQASRSCGQQLHVRGDQGCHPAGPPSFLSLPLYEAMDGERCTSRKPGRRGQGSGQWQGRARAPGARAGDRVGVC